MGNVALPSNVASGFIIGTVESDSPGSVNEARRKTSFPRCRTDCDPGANPPSVPAPAPDPLPDPLAASTPASIPGALPEPLSVPDDPPRGPLPDPSDPLPDGFMGPPSPGDSVLVAPPPEEEPHRTEPRANAASDSAGIRVRRLIAFTVARAIMRYESRETRISAHLSDESDTTVPTRGTRVFQRTPSSDSSVTKVGGPPTVPLKAATDEGLFRLLLVPSGPPTLVPAKPATVDGLLRLGLVPSGPPVAVPVKPDTVEGLLKLVFRIPVGTTTAPFETFVANPAPVEVVGVVVAAPAASAVAIDVTGGVRATLGAVLTSVGAALGAATTGLAVDVVVAIVVEALVVVMVVEAFTVVIVVDGGIALALALGTGATLETSAAGLAAAVEMMASAAVPTAVPTETLGLLWASARIPESASAAPRARGKGVRAKAARFMG
jgi:hypothetical protein